MLGGSGGVGELGVLDEPDILLELFVVDYVAAALHVEQQFFEGEGEFVFVVVVVLGEGDELAFHGLLEDAHVDLVVEGQDLIPEFAVDQYLLEVYHPLLYLVIHRTVLEQLVVLQKRSRVHPLPLARSFLLAEVPVRRTLLLTPGGTAALWEDRESLQLLLYGSHCLEYGTQLLPHPPHAPTTVFVQIGPVLLQDLLDLLEQVQRLLDDVGGVGGVGVGERVLVCDGVSETALGHAVRTEFLFDETVLAVLRGGFVGGSAATRGWRLVWGVGRLVWVASKHIM